MTTYPPVDRAHVFISYSHEDYERFALPLATRLRGLAKGYALLPPGEGSFFDRKSIRPGDDWDRVIRSQLNEASVFLILVSNNFNNSWYGCNVELPLILRRHAQRPELKVVPILLDSVELRTVRSETNPELGSLERFDAVPKAVRQGRTIDLPWMKWKNHQSALDAIGQALAQLFRPLDDFSTRSPERELEDLRADSWSLRASFLPFLVDRDSQDRCVQDMIEQQIRRGGDRLRPALLVLSGSEEDCPDQYVERLAVDTVPKSLGLEPGETPGDLIRPIRWPDDDLTARNRIQTHFRRQLLRNHAGLDVASSDEALFESHRRARRCRFYVMHVPSQHSLRQVGRVLSVLAGMLAEWPDLARSNGLFFIAILAPRAQEEDLSAEQRRIARQAQISQSWLPPLAGVEAHHARAWGTEVMTTWAGALPGDFVKRVFADMTTLAMREFALAVKGLLKPAQH